MPASGGSRFYRVAALPAFTSLSQPGTVSAYAASNISGLNTVGYAGAVFDGRYVYFVPYQDGTSVHGRVLRYDTQGEYSDASSWMAYDASGTGTGGAVGYTGGEYDGRYLYFAPYRNTNNLHGIVLRFDGRLPRGIPPTITGGSNL